MSASIGPFQHLDCLLWNGAYIHRLRILRPRWTSHAATRRTQSGANLLGFADPPAQFRPSLLERARASIKAATSVIILLPSNARLASELFAASASPEPHASAIITGISPTSQACPAA